MADVAVAPKKVKAAASKGDKKAKKPSTHPPVNNMVLAALASLKERNGTSLQAVKKYIGANYKCDVTKLSPFIKKSLKNGVAKGVLVQTKGTGAAGSFKLKPKAKASGEKAKTKVVKKPAKKLTAGVAKPKKAAGAKKVKPASAGGAKKKVTAPKQKSTKASKSVAKKPKAPKPKKATGASKKVAKK
ncbi:histone H1-like [Armigeres subalbatus]|uniref:histone H1-like n=1 Tax=Armigeres subalbatus TaxID=124917 RepID=UPI002ED65D26